MKSVRSVKSLIIIIGLACTAALLTGGFLACYLKPHTAEAGIQPTSTSGRPRVVLKETEQNLGTLDPSDKCRHVFVVRNEGDAPLKIAKAGTTCKCTVSVLPAGDIPPGKAGPIEIESKTDDTHGRFSHSAAFVTNDPDNPRFELTIKGEIRSFITAKPTSIMLEDLKRGEPVEMTANILSEVWENFSLTNIETNIDGLQWTYQPLPYQQVYKLNNNAKSGYLLTLRLPGDRKDTAFDGFFKAEATDGKPDSQRREIRLVLSGRAAAIRTVYGPLVDHEGVVTIGTLGLGESAQANLLLQVRGEHRKLRILEVQKSPEFLEVSVSTELAEKGIYKIVVRVPPNAPPGNFMPPHKMGQLRIITDHPEMPEIVKLDVAFVVLPEITAK